MYYVSTVANWATVREPIYKILCMALSYFGINSISFAYNKNRRGPKIEHWGTLRLMVVGHPQWSEK